MATLVYRNKSLDGPSCLSKSLLSVDFLAVANDKSGDERNCIRNATNTAAMRIARSVGFDISEDVALAGKSDADDACDTPLTTRSCDSTLPTICSLRRALATIPRMQLQN